MGSVRGVWVIKPETEEVLFTRRFPTVEFRFKRSLGGQYHPLPTDNDLVSAVTLRCSTSYDEFIPERDSVKCKLEWPVVELFGGKIWPVVCLKKNEFLFVAVVPFEPSEGVRPPIIRINGVPTAIALLTTMSEILGTDTNDLKHSSPLVVELSQFICLSAPFGIPCDNNPNNIKLQQQFKKSVIFPKEKMPSWRPAVYKGPSKINVFIKEQIKAAQYDKASILDVSKIYGSVLCKAELEGHPDVIISLTTPPGSTPIDNVLVHSCVQSADVDPITGTNVELDGTHTRKIRFSPPLDPFTVCHYQSLSVELPIRGFYQMKGDKVVELLIQLKLMENIKNSFEYCEVHIPFFNRGPIEKIDNVNPTSANLTISKDKQTVIWIIGQKFPQKNLEMSLGASVSFVEFPPEDMPSSYDTRGMIDEQFCVEQNAFCEIHFKITDYTLSGCNIDHRAMTLLPQIKFKSALVREIVSSEYRIWNSHGDVPGMQNDITELSLTLSKEH